jgi:C4-dicarboxylate-specific signal transduction histidine kinase
MNLIFQGIQRQMVSLGSEQIMLMPTRVDSLAEGAPSLKTAQDEWFRARYGNEPVELMIPVSTAPLLMAIEFRNRFKPGTPIVACCPYPNTLGASASPLTGVFGQYPWKENVALIKHLFPNTRQIALVGGATPSDRALNRPVGEILSQQSPPLGFIDLTGLSAPQQVERVRNLPADTVLMFGSFLNDVEGNEVQHGTGGLRSSLARESNSPLFFVTELNFGQGGFGGYMVNWLELGEELGKLGLSILSGAIETNFPILPSKSIHLRLDWRELERWKVPLSRVPKEASIEFRPPSLWETHASAVVLSIIALAGQAAGIGFLLVERRRRRISRNQLAERLRFETLLAEISSTFANRDDSDLGPPIQDALRRIGLFFEATLAGVWQVHQNPLTIVQSHAWPDNNGKVSTTVLLERFPAIIQRLLHGEAVHFPSESEAVQFDDRVVQEIGVASFLAVPLRSGEQIIGALSLQNEREEKSWPPDLVMRLRLIADMLGSALARQNASQALRESELARQKLNEKAAQMNRVTEMGQLVASLTHELTQPLTAILSNAQAASRIIVRPSADLLEVRATLGDIIEDNERARAILTNMRGAFKKHTISPHPVNLNEIVDKVVLMVKNNAHLRDVRLQATLFPKAVLVKADEVPVQQVLLNLIHNAMDAMCDQPAERRCLIVKTSVEPQAHCGLLVVDDQGPGIPESVKETIFSPFFTTKNDGLGMGLTICQELLRALGGSIGFEDRPEGGARFRVELPLVSY